MGQSSLYVILPIFNESLLISSLPPWAVSEDLFYKELEENEIRLIQEEPSIIFQISEARNDVFLLSLTGIDITDKKKENKLEDKIRMDALSLQTVFNLVGQEETMVIPYGIVIEKGQILKLLYVFDLEQDFLPAKIKPYRILPNVTSDEIQNLISVTREIIRKDKTLQTTFRRFCSAFRKLNWEDRLIDLTIALESLIPTRTEISFQFAFFLSLMITDDVEERKNIFSKLSDLYTARSGIVHGSGSDRDIKKAIQNSKENWKELVDYSKRCIFYRLEFRIRYPDQDWKKHIQSLGFGEHPLN